MIENNICVKGAVIMIGNCTFLNKLLLKCNYFKKSDIVTMDITMPEMDGIALIAGTGTKISFTIA